MSKCVWEVAYVALQPMLASDIIIYALEEIRNGLVIPNLHELNAKLILVHFEPIELNSGIDNDFFNVFEWALGCPIREDNQVQPRMSFSLTSIEVFEGLNELIKVPFQTLVSRRISSWLETTKIP